MLLGKISFKHLISCSMWWTNLSNLANQSLSTTLISSHFSLSFFLLLPSFHLFKNSIEERERARKKKIHLQLHVIHCALITRRQLCNSTSKVKSLLRIIQVICHVMKYFLVLGSKYWVQEIKEKLKKKFNCTRSMDKNAKFQLRLVTFAMKKSWLLTRLAAIDKLHTYLQSH